MKLSASSRMSNRPASDPPPGGDDFAAREGRAAGLSESSAPVPEFVRLTELLPGPLVAGAAYLILIVLVMWEYLRPGQLPSIPVYYLGPLALVAWFVGWKPALIATALTAVVSSGVLLWRAPTVSYSTLFYIGRLATFLAAALGARGLFIARLMLDFYYRGSAWRSIQSSRRVSSGIIIVPILDGTAHPEFVKEKPDDIPILIHPGLAFGTASHPTTQMCLTLLEKLMPPGGVILDVGSGTGILAIAAAKLGAARALAVDVDPEAGRVAQINISANGVSDTVEFRLGSLEAVIDSGSNPLETSATGGRPNDGMTFVEGDLRFDLIVANIFSHVIIELINRGLLEMLDHGGALIFSGIRRAELERFQKVLEAKSLQVEEILLEEEWAAVAARRASNG